MYKELHLRVALQVLERLTTRIPHGIFAAGGAFVPTQEKKKKKNFRKWEDIMKSEHFLVTKSSAYAVLPKQIFGTSAQKKCRNRYQTF